MKKADTGITENPRLCTVEQVAPFNRENRGSSLLETSRSKSRRRAPADRHCYVTWALQRAMTFSVKGSVLMLSRLRLPSATSSTIIAARAISSSAWPAFQSTLVSFAQ
jgi:hypothetical protein